MSEFKREDRYIIIKRSDLKKVPVAYRSALVDPMFSLLSHLPRREFVVVEHDWPEYQLVWAMIEHRMAGKPVPDFNLWRRADALQALLTAADERADSFDRLYTSSLDERDQLQQRADVLEGLLLQTNELLYAIQGDPGAVPSSSIDSMRGRVFEALKRDRSTSVLHPQNL
ncbi:hypothetical protein CUU62_27145 [Pseudomonas sp. WP001]|nr:hypothetical protein CUU62_27145 [Pseudomonas sp. WP001]